MSEYLGNLRYNYRYLLDGAKDDQELSRINIKTCFIFLYNVKSSTYNFFTQYAPNYRNDPKLLNRQVWANNVVSLIRVYTVCQSVCIFLTHCAVVKWYCSNFRMITAIFSSVRIFRIFTVIKFYKGWCLLKYLLVTASYFTKESISSKYEAGHEKMCLMSYANNSLISAFVVRCLDSIIYL